MKDFAIEINRRENRPGEMFFLLLPTLECNLRCDYCFEERIPGRWSVDQTKEIISKVLESCKFLKIEVCRFHWQGGEPLLLGVDFWEEILGYSVKLAENLGIRLSQSMQTNLTRYQTEFSSIAHEYFSGVLGSSFELSNSRKMNNGDSKYFKKLWTEALDKARNDGISVGVLSLLNDEILDMGAKACLNELHDTYGIDKLRFSLPFRLFGNRGYWLEAGETGDFLGDAFVFWLEKGANQWMEIRPFQYLKQRLEGGHTQENGLCMHSKNCTDIAMTIFTNGDIGLCDNFAHPDSELVYGNILQQDFIEIYNSRTRSLTRNKVAALTNDQCMSCRYLQFCFGGCYVRSRKVPDKENYHDHYCESYKRLFETIENEIFNGSIMSENSIC